MQKAIYHRWNRPHPWQVLAAAGPLQENFQREHWVIQVLLKTLVMNYQAIKKFIKK
jgi:hypothetical protein